MMKRQKTSVFTKSLKVLTFFILILTLLVQSAIIYSPINQIGDNIAISTSEINDISTTTTFPIKFNVKKSGYNSAILDFRLFDLFTLKSIKANIVEDEQIYLGGDPIGISLKTDGVIITGKTDVITKSGLQSPTKNADVASGDVLTKLNNKDIKCLNDIRRFLNSNNDKVVTATIRRGYKVYETDFEPAIDTLSGEKRLGLYIKEEISGVGTLTYVKAGDYKYGALGHNVSESLIGNDTSNVSGKIYKCNIVDVKKGERGNAGELRGFFSRIQPTGNIEKSSSYGIYGYADKSIIHGREPIVMASRFSVKAGKAEIWTTVDGEKAQKYEIEIIKLNYQKSQAEKGMVIRVTDNRLLEKTGGIVQGMSGSPIVQNGKLIGAVTHVFINDPTKGYGIYIDWMKDN